MRINLGLFHHDVNVVWDLAPHDLSIMDYLIGRLPKSLSAFGTCRADNDHEIEDVAHLNLDFGGGLMASFHVNWLSPVKIRHFILGGSRKSLIYNDLEPAEKIKVYDRGVTISRDPEARRGVLIGYRTGDIWSPHVDGTEPLQAMVRHFADCIRDGRLCLPGLRDDSALGASGSPACASRPRGGRSAFLPYAHIVRLPLAERIWLRGPVRMFEAFDSNDAPAAVGRAFTRIMAVYAFIGIGLCVLKNEAIAVICSPEYAGAAGLVDALVLGLGLSSAAALMDAPFFVRRRTGLKPWINLATALVMFGLFTWLIPRWGAAGAAWAFVLGTAFHVAVTFVVSHRVFRVQYEPVRVAAMAILAMGVVEGAEFLGAGLVPAIGKIALWLAWPLALWTTGLVNPAEKQWVRQTVQRTLFPSPGVHAWVAVADAKGLQPLRGASHDCAIVSESTPGTKKAP